MRRTNCAIPLSVKFLFENPTDIYYKEWFILWKVMDELKPCQECDQKHKCQEIYQQCGKTKGPSVVLKVAAAFLLPLLIFIASLAAFEGILARITDTKGLRIILGFLLALSVTFAAILVTTAIN